MECSVTPVGVSEFSETGISGPGPLQRVYIYIYIYIYKGPGEVPLRRPPLSGPLYMYMYIYICMYTLCKGPGPEILVCPVQFLRFFIIQV